MRSGEISSVSISTPFAGELVSAPAPVVELRLAPINLTWFESTAEDEFAADPIAAKATLAVKLAAPAARMMAAAARPAGVVDSAAAALVGCTDAAESTRPVDSAAPAEAEHAADTDQAAPGVASVAAPCVAATPATASKTLDAMTALAPHGCTPVAASGRPADRDAPARVRLIAAARNVVAIDSDAIPAVGCAASATSGRPTDSMPAPRVADAPETVPSRFVCAGGAAVDGAGTSPNGASPNGASPKPIRTPASRR